MTRSLYLVVSRSSVVLIAALVAAPLWDFWRFGRIVPAGGAGFPVAAILQVARDAEAAVEDATTSRPVSPAPASVTLSPRASVMASTSASVAPSPAGPAAIPAARRASTNAAVPSHAATVAAPRPAFEAWTAWGQVDPFWDGSDRPAGRTETERAEAGTDAPAETIEDEGTSAPDGEASSAARAARGSSGSTRHESGAATGDDAPAMEGDDRAAEAESRVDHIDGWVIGPQPPPEPTDEVSEPAPEPPPPGGGTTSGGVAPSDPKREPRPRPSTWPSVRIDIPTGTIDVGEAFDVSIRADSVEEMTSLPFHVLFDPAILSFVSARTGSGLGTLQPVLLASVNPNRPGDLAVGLSLIETAGSFSGAGELIVLRFQAVASGRSDLAFSQATLRGGASEAVETRFTGATVNVR